MNFRLWLARMVIPSTHVVAPKEPTRKMIKAACAAMSPGKRPTSEWVSVQAKHKIRYQAMISDMQ